ncbi:serine protease inhibitor Cvsi-2-like [Ostrea edulis]|uniref:serine protease inhibitor Cvsi-2-like n=1 Tax=Ostrea edulis TaxID=37623 RepID=UPI0024AEDFF5|nr:serine protease inhibitor Cvsi-2-like [Ostrea edulis]
MKVILILAIVIVAVYAEVCTTGPRDCSLTVCPTGAELHCVDSLCTCTTPAIGSGACSTGPDCHERCPHGRPHCIDGHCRCGHQ